MRYCTVALLPCYFCSYMYMILVILQDAYNQTKWRSTNKCFLWKPYCTTGKTTHCTCFYTCVHFHVLYYIQCAVLLTKYCNWNNSEILVLMGGDSTQPDEYPRRSCWLIPREIYIITNSAQRCFSVSIIGNLTCIIIKQDANSESRLSQRYVMELKFEICLNN